MPRSEYSAKVLWPSANARRSMRCAAPNIRSSQTWLKPKSGTEQPEERLLNFPRKFFTRNLSEYDISQPNSLLKTKVSPERKGMAPDHTVVKAVPTSDEKNAPFQPASLESVIQKINELKPAVLFAPHIET